MIRETARAMFRGWIEDLKVAAIVNGRYGEIHAINDKGAEIGTIGSVPPYPSYQEQREICKEYEKRGYVFTPTKNWRGDLLQIRRPKVRAPK